MEVSILSICSASQMTVTPPPNPMYTLNIHMCAQFHVWFCDCLYHSNPFLFGATRSIILIFWRYQRSPITTFSTLRLQQQSHVTHYLKMQLSNLVGNYISHPTVPISYNSTELYPSNCPTVSSYIHLGGNSPSRLFIILTPLSTFYFFNHSTVFSSCIHLSIHPFTQSPIHWAPSVCQEPS